MATDRYQNRYRPTERGNQFGNDGVGDIKKDTATVRGEGGVQTEGVTPYRAL